MGKPTGMESVKTHTKFSRPSDKSAELKLFFLFLNQNIMLLVLKRTVSMRQVFWVPRQHVKTEVQENVSTFTCDLFCLSWHMIQDIYYSNIVENLGQNMCLSIKYRH